MLSKNTGKVITKIKNNKSNITIYFGKEKLTVDNDTFASFYLYQGKILSDKELDEIRKVSDASKYFRYALSLLSKRIYTELNMREKLYAKGANKGQVDRLIIVLKKNDLISDKAFIEDYIEYANEKGYGKNKIIANLTRKGIFKSDIAKISFPLAKERSKAKNTLPRLEKQYDKYNEASKREHIKAALIRQGFDIEVANEVVGYIKPNNKSDEISKLKKDIKATKTRLARKYQGRELKEKCIQCLIRKGYHLNDIIKEME